MKPLLALALSLFALSARADPYFMDGNALQGRLARQDPSAAAYVLGVYDGIEIIQYHAPSAQRLMCPPAATSGSELLDAVRGYMEAEPGLLEYPAAILVLRALIWAFPCDRT
jgi:hypothetical protein